MDAPKPMNHCKGTFGSFSSYFRACAAPMIASVHLMVSLSVAAADFTFSQPVDRVAFGSCSMPEVAQPVWDAVLKAEPDVWIWAGDAIYADTMDINRIRMLYEMQNSYEKYALVRRKIRVLGTWDDHDYGANDVGKEYPLKKASQQAFLDFLGEPAAGVRRSREGVYASYLFGPPGRRLKILLLDVRYHRDTPGPDADILGNAQWAWLEAELQRRDASVTLLVSGTAILSTEHKTSKWGDYPRARARLLRAVDASPKPVVLLSGDLHYAEISEITTPRGRPLPEITSSGMTHSARNAHYVSAIRVGNIYFGLNFGLVTVTWGPTADTVRLEVLDTDGTPRVSEAVVYGKRKRAR